MRRTSSETNGIAARPFIESLASAAPGYHIRTIKEMPDYTELRKHIALKVGDVIGSARPSLDHAVWHLVTDHVGPNPKRARSIGFP